MRKAGLIHLQTMINPFQLSDMSSRASISPGPGLTSVRLGTLCVSEYLLELRLKLLLHVQKMSRRKISKDLGHFWLGYLMMLGHLQMSAHPSLSLV